MEPAANRRDATFPEAAAIDAMPGNQDVRRARSRAAAAAVLFVLWVGALTALTVATANPPQVNLAQLSQAQEIVTARVEEVASGKVQVLRRWTPGPDSGELAVTNLREAGARAGLDYVLALVPDNADRSRFRIVGDPDQGRPLYLYPATPEIEAQVTAWQAVPEVVRQAR